MLQQKVQLTTWKESVATKEKKIGNFGRFFSDFSVFGGSGKKNPWKKSTEKISAKNRRFFV